MRLPTRLPAHHPAQKIVAATIIAIAATLMASGARQAEVRWNPLVRLDEALYDSMYRLRKPEDRMQGNVVILTLDDVSLQQANAGLFGDPFGWPWPRFTWAALVPYLERHGARVVVFDMLFTERSPYSRELGDDKLFGTAIGQARIPVILGTVVNPDGSPGPLPPDMTSELAQPSFGAVNYQFGTVAREFDPIVHGMPSLALRAATAMRGAPVAGASDEPFLVHYYGPARSARHAGTFRYLSVAPVIAAAADEAANGKPSEDFGIDPRLFQDKIVLVGSTATSLFDLYASPLSAQYPGVEYQATAIENFLNGQRVRSVSPGVAAAVTLLAAFLAAAGVTLPRQTALKLAAALAAVLAVLLVAAVLFRGVVIQWLPLASPLSALMLATIASFAWSYLTEGRQRKLVFRALSQAVSPEMAAEIERNPDALRLGGARREMTVMFTDIAGFTDLSETMEVEKLTELMNFYLEEMSSVVLSAQGYVDKYIGDAIMSFWNGPIGQPDHAVRACRAALGMRQREVAMADEFARRNAKGLLTRIGINTGPMALGNMGSSLKFSYTVLGDSVNLGSRLEGANKLYGSQILMAQTTAELVRDQFVVRQLDLLRVKGKKKPMPVFELIHEGRPDATTRIRVEKYEQALGLYQTQQWDEAEAVLRDLTRVVPSDAPALNLISRICKLRADPPEPAWDGVFVAKDK